MAWITDTRNGDCEEANVSITTGDEEQMLST